MKYSIGNIVNDDEIAMYGIRGVVVLWGLSLCKGCKCLITRLLCTPETNSKKQKNKHLEMCDWILSPFHSEKYKGLESC